MVKCLICIGEKGRSKEYQHLHFHLQKKHGMVVRDYRNQYPNAPVTSPEFKNKQRKLMKQRRKNIPDLEQKLHQWRQQENEIDLDDDFYENPSFEDLENIKRREEWCRMMLGSGVKGQQYKRIYKDLMECRQAMDVVYEKLMKETM